MELTPCNDSRKFATVFSTGAQATDFRVASHRDAVHKLPKRIQGTGDYRRLQRNGMKMEERRIRRLREK